MDDVAVVYMIVVDVVVVDVVVVNMIDNYVRFGTYHQPDFDHQS